MTPAGGRCAFARGSGARLTAVLATACVLLSSCGSSGKGLIPVGDAGPLQNDFQAVARAAEEGNGSCAATEAAIDRTERDFNALPLAVDAGLRRRLREGIANLRARSLALCTQPLPQPTNTTTSTPTTTTTTTTPTQTQTTPTQTTPPTSPPEEGSGPGGGTPGPGEEAQPPPGGERGDGEGKAGGGGEEGGK